MGFSVESLRFQFDGSRCGVLGVGFRDEDVGFTAGDMRRCSSGSVSCFQACGSGEMIEDLNFADGIIDLGSRRVFEQVALGGPVNY